jgi:cobalt-zinc-cadmium efflux system protein
VISREILEKEFRIFVILSAFILALELTGALLTNSLALLSDSFHVLTDLISLFLAYFSIRLARRGANRRFTFGYYRAEIISAALNGALLLLISAYIFYSSYIRFLNPAPVRGEEMLGISIIGLAANAYVAIKMHTRAEGNLNVRGAYIHVISDTLSSIGVVIGGAIISITGITIVDPIISSVIGFFILSNAMPLVRDSLLILMEGSPLDVKSIERDMANIDGVKGVHDVHVWSISSDIYALSSHIIVDSDARINVIIQDVNRMLKERYNIIHTTIQSECDRCANEKEIKDVRD